MRPALFGLPIGVLLSFLLAVLAGDEASAQETTTAPVMAGLYNDALPPEPPPWTETVPLAALDDIEDPAPGFFETSEYMIGSVAVGVIFLESDGSLDRSTEDWTPGQQTFAVQKLREALDWWAGQEPAANLSFVVERAEDTVPTRYEPISRPSKTTLFG